MKKKIKPEERFVKLLEKHEREQANELGTIEFLGMIFRRDHTMQRVLIGDQTLLTFTYMKDMYIPSMQITATCVEENISDETLEWYMTFNVCGISATANDTKLINVLRQINDQVYLEARTLFGLFKSYGFL